MKALPIIGVIFLTGCSIDINGYYSKRNNNTEYCLVKISENVYNVLPCKK